MDFELSDDQRAIQSLCRDFAREEVAPHAEELDAKAEFPYEIIAKMAELGLMGLPFPEEWGGSGGDTVSYALAVMEIARADASTAITLAAHVSLGSMPFFLFGTKEQKERYLIPLAQGKMLWGFGLTEPQAGSDAGATRTRAELRGGTWVINGTKAFITNSGTDITGGTTITAVTGKGADGRSEISNIVVPQDTPGFTRSRKYKKMGWRASDTRELAFENAAVPEDCLLGPQGAGFKQFLTILDGWAHLRRGAFGRSRARRVRPSAGLCQGPASVRQADFEIPSDSIQTCRHAVRNRTRPLNGSESRLGKGYRTRLRADRQPRETVLG